jgi:hypothetical protein
MPLEGKIGRKILIKLLLLCIIIVIICRKAITKAQPRASRKLET